MPPTLRTLLLNTAVWLALAGKALAAGPLEVTAKRVGDLFEVRASATVLAPLPVVWGTLTDYERLPEFIPGLQRSRIIRRNGATTTVEQTGEARFLFLTVPIEVVTESTERPSRHRSAPDRRAAAPPAGSLRHRGAGHPAGRRCSCAGPAASRWMSSCRR
jgi:hypothetical protein